VSEARTAILDRVRAGQRSAFLPPVSSAAGLPEPPAIGPEACLERFRAELTELGVESHVEDTPEAVRARVASLTSGRSVLSWDPERLPYDVAVTDALRGSDARDAQARAEMGLTGCDAAIAETGSLVLLSGPGKSRAVSLLPPVHLAVVPRSVLCFSLGEFFRTRAEALGGAAACTLITGPSRTADIELTLTLGVHGPGQVIVVIGP
jgi:L-lactate dehydrogenase complex protein LldG